MSKLFFSTMPILVSALLFFGCIDVIHANEKATSYIASKKNLLTDKQIRSLDDHAVKTLSECSFLYRKAPVGTVTADAIYQCIEGSDPWFWSAGYKNLGLSYEQISDFHGQFYSLKYPGGLPDTQLSRFHILDDYLGKRILPYISAIPRLDQEKLLRKVFAFYSDNLIFIKAMMDKGVLIKNVLLDQVGQGGNSWVSCEAYMLVLNENIGFYKNKKTLYELVPGYDKGVGSSSRWMDLLQLTDPAYNICPEVIGRLVQASPELLNKRDSWNMATPLNQFISSHVDTPKRIQIIKMLTTPVNINLKNKVGNTPLHTFLKGADPDAKSSGDLAIVKWLIEQGANIDLKDKQGISVRELILKRKDLSGLQVKSKSY